MAGSRHGLSGTCRAWQPTISHHEPWITMEIHGLRTRSSLSGSTRRRELRVPRRLLRRPLQREGVGAGEGPRRTRCSIPLRRWPPARGCSSARIAGMGIRAPPRQANTQRCPTANACCRGVVGQMSQGSTAGANWLMYGGRTRSRRCSGACARGRRGGGRHRCR